MMLLERLWGLFELIAPVEVGEAPFITNLTVGEEMRFVEASIVVVALKSNRMSRII